LLSFHRLQHEGQGHGEVGLLSLPSAHNSIWWWRGHAQDKRLCGPAIPKALELGKEIGGHTAHSSCWTATKWSSQSEYPKSTLPCPPVLQRWGKWSSHFTPYPSLKVTRIGQFSPTMKTVLPKFHLQGALWACRQAPLIGFSDLESNMPHSTGAEWLKERRKEGWEEDSSPSISIDFARWYVVIFARGLQDALAANRTECACGCVRVCVFQQCPDTLKSTFLIAWWLLRWYLSMDFVFGAREDCCKFILVWRPFDWIPLLSTASPASAVCASFSWRDWHFLVDWVCLEAQVRRNSQSHSCFPFPSPSSPIQCVPRHFSPQSYRNLSEMGLEEWDQSQVNKSS